MNIINRKALKSFTFYVEAIFFTVSYIFVFYFYATVLGICNDTKNSDGILWDDIKACENEYNKTYSWSYDSRWWSFNVKIPNDIYASYTHYGGSRSPYTSSQMAAFITSDDPVVIEIANILAKLAYGTGYGYYDTVNFVLNFVQSLEYAHDNITTLSNEYWRFPIETLVDGGGDCKDRSILFVSIIEVMGYDAVLIDLPGHIAVGIAGNDFYGSYYLRGDIKYYYCETTGKGWMMGETPSMYQEQMANIIQIGRCKQTY